ncbi:MAG: carboxypeptidase regulatory-like domain-containing protein [Deltaproteobacteria bacterium]|nr:carboxypeptidase regulatory-like domain-containing protein [Deltaproteobacteria bacterium]
MRQRALWIVLAIAVVGGGVFWWKRSRSSEEDPATASAGATPQGAGATVAAAGSPKKPAPGTQAPASLEVTVTDGASPIANAAVRIAPDEGEVILVRTGADGVARAERLEPGECEVSASAPDRLPAGVREQKLVAGQQTKVALVLRAGGRSLSGTVTDVSGGAVAGARIDAAALDAQIRPGAAVASTTTGADGKYAMTVAEGHLLVAARSADYAPQTRYVEVGASGATADFALVPGGVIEGIVRDDRTKQPVPGAIVSARRDAGQMMLAEGGGRMATAGPDGKFRLTGLRPGAYDLDAREDRRHTKSPTIVGLGVAENVTDVEILIGVGPVVRGKVVDEKDAPVAGARLMAFGDGGGGSTDAKSDANGAFEVTGLPPGKYELNAHGDTHVHARPGAAIELKDADIDGVIVRVQTGVRLKGHVEPRQVAEVTFDPERLEGMMQMGLIALVAPAVTDGSGEFTIGPLMPMKGTVSARSNDSGERGEAAVDVRPGMPEVVVKLAPGGSIAGRVVDGEGKPVAGVTVAANPAGGNERTTIVNGRITSGVQGLTGASGAFELRGVAPGTYRLAALDRGRPMRLRNKPPVVKLGPAEKKTGVELGVDRPNGTIKGVVTDAGGAPIADAWVSVHQELHDMVEGMRGADGAGPDGESGGRTMMVVATSDDGPGGALGGGDFPPALTDAQGRFAIGGLPHTKFEVIAEARAGKLRGRANDVTPDATVTIKALGVTSLSGTVVGPKGKPALFSVEIDGPTHAQRNFTDGEFALGRVDPGKYHVTVKSADGNGEADVTVEPDRAAMVEIVLTANAYVVGTLVDGAGVPVANLGLTVVDDAPDGMVRISISGPPPMSGPDGKFRVEHKAGKVALAVLNPGGPPTIKRGLVLEAGKTLDVGQVRVDVAPPPPPPR